MNDLEKFFDSKNENLVSPETISIAENALRDFLKLKPEERVLLLKENISNQNTVSILREAIKKIGSTFNELHVTEDVTRKELQKLLKENDVIINTTLNGYKATDNLHDTDIVKFNNRLLDLADLGPESFQKDGGMTENLAEMEHRLNKMEAILKEVDGLQITSEYGTNLEVGLRPFEERRWYKDTGIIAGPGKWDNLPGGEIFTTPDERKVNGTLVLPVMDSEISGEQGVDEFVKVNIKNGLITSIQGGKSAEKLRKKLEEEAIREHSEGSNPLNVYQVAEISFGANSKARSSVADPEQPYNYPAVSVVEAEKRFGTMHIAFGSTKHGEEGAEGFIDALSHYDFVIPRNGLTVETFNGERNWQKKKNGKKIISSGSLNFF